MNQRHDQDIKRSQDRIAPLSPLQYITMLQKDKAKAVKLLNPPADLNNSINLTDRIEANSIN